MTWCTVWKGALQDITDHVRYAHRVPEAVNNVRLEKIIPPWTVTREIYKESLTPRHSGISNDILLFSDIGLSLSHHYRVHKKGVPPKGDLRSRTVRDWRSRRRRWAVINDCPDVRSLADTYRGSHTNRPSSDGIGPAGHGGSYGVGLPAPSAARGNGVRGFGTGGDMFHNEGQCDHISTSRT